MPIGLPSFRRFLTAQLGVLQVLDRTVESDAPRLAAARTALGALADRPTIAKMPTVSRLRPAYPLPRTRCRSIVCDLTSSAPVDVGRWETAMHLLLAAIAAAQPDLTLSNTNRNRLRRGFSLCWIGLHQPIVDMVSIGESLSHR